MDLKKFIKDFDFKKPDWSRLPDGFPDCDLSGFSSEEIGRFNAIKGLWELSLPERPKSRSRVWTSSNGYIYLVPWSNASLLRILGRKFTDTLPARERRLKAQLDDAARSVIANIEEGFARPTTSEYLTFLGYSQGSLKEVKGDIQRCGQDGFLRSVPGSSLAGIGIDLKDWHEALKKSVISTANDRGIYRNLEEVRERNDRSSIDLHSTANDRGIYRNLEEVRERNDRFSIALEYPPRSSKKSKGSYRRLEDFKGEQYQFGYPAVDDLAPQFITYEIFIEIINKTDWHLRRLVESLERKLGQERKGYQVEKARIRDTF